MTTTLSEGVKVPDVGSVNWAGDLEVNWNLLNGALANLSGNVKLDRDNIWTGEQTFSLPIVGSIAGTASKAIADEDGTSIKTGYVNVAGNQTVTGDKSFTGSNTFNNILPNATNTYALGSSSYQWSSVYAQSYYYKSSALEIGVQPASNNTATTFWLDKNDNNLGYTRFVEYANSIQTYEIYVRNKASNGALDPNGSQIAGSLQLALFPSTATSSVVANTTNIIPGTTNAIDLGTSTNKWKTLNGINPGALSFPNLAGAVNIASSITDTAGGDNFYTVPSNGWVSVIVGGRSNLMVFAPSESTIYYGSQAVSPDNEGNTWCSIPVPAGYKVRIRVIGAIIGAAFYPCLGNV